MDNIERLKLSNEVSMKVMKNDFPINGKTVITIIMDNNQPSYIDVKNLKKRNVKGV